ncbi:cytochrome c oxidase-assembly factor COX23 mitochondrial [Fusarium napiforme]|uniref:Cytochrome c oxidase-assembly factor COX23 mitochondrial n=1 Tax=Fusarium napiforme TaxID=42672 RepID=A0A8H5IHM7_9HYPO|nr:cytochrome c oxidase-assembly factor COX23 mitochondrial [Fusarium napiforme]
MSSSPKDTTEATEPPKSSDTDNQAWNEDKRRKFETSATAPPVNDRDTDEAMLLWMEQSGQGADARAGHIAIANKHGPTNGKKKAAAGSNGDVRSRQPALTC